MQLVFSGRAEDDLEEIGDYIAQDNPSRAVTLYPRNARSLPPLDGVSECRATQAGIRRWSQEQHFGRYLIFYVLHDEVLEIRRVVHGARNLTALD